MEKASGELGLGDLTKQNIRRTLDQIQDRASSVLLLTVQWKDIEEQFDSTRNALEARAKEVEALEESIKARILEVEKKEERLRLVEARDKELGSIHESIKEELNELEKREKEFHEKQKLNIEKRRVEMELMEVSLKQLELVLESVAEKLKELDTGAQGFVMLKKSTEDSFKELKALEESIQKEKEELVLNLKQLRSCAENFETSRLGFEPLVSLSVANTGSSLTLASKCSQIYLNENQDNGIDGLSKNKAALASVVLSLDSAKLVLDDLEGLYLPYLKKGDGELDGSVAGSCITLLEKLMKMNPTIGPEVKKEATRLGIEWVDKATRNPENSSQVLGCLLFVAVYGLASIFTHQMLLNLLECVLSCDQAPKLFQLLGLDDKVSGVIESLIKKEEYFPAIKFICEFKLFKFNPGSLMHKYLNNSEKAAEKIAGTDEEKAFREKQKADVAIVLEYIKEKKLEPKFPVKLLKNLLARLEKQLAAAEATELIHQSDEKCQTTSSSIEVSATVSRTVPSEQKNGTKRKRISEPMAPYQNPTVNGVGSGTIPSGEEIEESGANCQLETRAPFSFPSTETEPNVLSNPINGDSSRASAVNHSVEETDLFHALRCAPDPAKQVLNSAMVLHPTNLEGEYEFKLRVSSDSCLLLLNQLKMLSPQIEQLVKDEAKKLAVAWKSKLSKNKSDHVEVVCFLMFLVIFGVASEFKANDLLALLENGYWRTVSPDLCQSLGLTNAIPGFIQNMIKTGQRLRAINYIYALDVVERFPPVSIINDFLRFTKKSAEWSCENAKNVTALKVAAMNKQIKALRDAVRCILHHNLESQFQFASLEEEIKSLLKEVSELKTQADGSKPDSTNPQTQKPKAESRPLSLSFSSGIVLFISPSSILPLSCITCCIAHFSRVLNFSSSPELIGFGSSCNSGFWVDCLLLVQTLRLPRIVCVEGCQIFAHLLCIFKIWNLLSLKWAELFAPGHFSCWGLKWAYRQEFSWSTMECNKEEALRAKELAEEKMGVGDFVGAQKLVMKVKQLFPDLENLQHLVAICDVHCSAQNKISGLENWYGILQVKHFADEATIRKQYRKLALLLHPDKNRFVGAEAAFKLVGEANRLLTDRTKRSQYDIKYRIFSRSSSLKPGTKQSNMNSSRQYAPANTAADSTGNQKPMDFAFWTCCEHCGFRYKYLREYVNTVMHCSSCQRPYVAVDTGRNGVSPRSTPSQFCERKEVPSHGPCNVPLQNNSAGPTGGRSGNAATEMGTNMMRKEKLNKNEVKNQNNDTEVWKPQKDKGGANNDAKNSKSEKNKGGIMNDAEVPKADAVKPQFEVTESESGATKPAPDVTDPKGDETATAKSKHKKKRRKVVEESNDSFEIDGCDNVGSEKAVNGNNKRRSSRNKRKASYSDNGSDDDFVSPPKASKSHGEFKSDDDMKEADLVGGLPGGANSDGSPAIAETHKEKTDKEADSVSEDILSNKDKRSEDCEANGEEAFPSTKVDKIDKVSKANKENPKLEECPDPDFSQFDRTISDFAVNQVWAIYDPLDGMPRFYARIRKVLTAQLKLQMTWLESLPVIQDPENEIDIPIACGKFESREMEETEDLLMFSHQMHCSKRGKNSIIYPKKGETWALFRDWDISWTTDPDKHKPPYRYDFVEVLSDFKEKAGDGGVSGIGVYYLKKVKGFVSLFVRATQEEVLACYFPPGEMNRFSHKVPSFKMTGKEREGVPPGSFELDPAALPKSIFEVDPCKVNAEMDRQSLDGQADGTCPKAPEVEVKSVAGPESVCSPKKREKIERESGSFSKVSNGISNDQTKIHTNLSSAVEVEGLTRGQDSSASCQVDEMNKVKKSEKSDQIVDTSRVRRSTRVLSEKNNQTSSSQRKAEQKSANDVELSAQSGQYGPSGNKMKTRKKPEKYVLMDSLRIRRSPRSLNKKIDGQLQGNPEKHENSDEPLPHSQKNGSLTESKGSISETRVSSSCRTGKENAYNFTEEKSEDKFRVDQIWALYSADKGMPTEYGLIKKIETTPRFRLFVAPLEPYPLPKISTRPVCCWLFKSKTQKGKLLERSSFSHQVSARRFNRNNYEVSPRKGEIWALYKNSNNTSCTDTNELDIVEVLENNGQIIKAMALTSNGSKTLYVAQRSQGSKTVVIEIPKADMGRFSHQIPAFRHETAKDELDCGSWELDPAAVPGLTIVLD